MTDVFTAIAATVRNDELRLRPLVASRYERGLDLREERSDRFFPLNQADNDVSVRNGARDSHAERLSCEDLPSTAYPDEDVPIVSAFEPPTPAAISGAAPALAREHANTTSTPGPASPSNRSDPTRQTAVDENENRRDSTSGMLGAPAFAAKRQHSIVSAMDNASPLYSLTTRRDEFVCAPRPTEVTVRIGRIDVRAVSAPVAPPTPVIRPKSSVSLEQHLQRRDAQR